MKKPIKYAAWAWLLLTGILSIHWLAPFLPRLPPTRPHAQAAQAFGIGGIRPHGLVNLPAAVGLPVQELQPRQYHAAAQGSRHGDLLRLQTKRRKR